MIHIDTAAYATIQDRGRVDHQRDAVPVSGPADPFAFRAAQALVGNEARDAAIECVSLPFAFHCDDARIVSVTGRDVSVRVRDRVPAWASIFVRAGEQITITGSERTRYAYIAVSGGIAAPVTLGSRSAYPRAGIGAVLRAGDALGLGPARRTAAHAGRRVSFDYVDAVGAIAGPHLDRFADETLSRFFEHAFTVTSQADRQGVRLDGESVAPRSGEILTCGVIAGAVQVPPGGEPIVLLADHQTTGGYPVIATVCEADLGCVAQRAPGELLRFYRLDRETALARRGALFRSLDTA